MMAAWMVKKYRQTGMRCGWYKYFFGRVGGLLVCLVLLGGVVWPPDSSAAALKIAAIFAQSGIAAENNALAINTVELAVDEINRRGGVQGRRLALTIIDNQSTPIGSQAAARRAVAEGVAAVIGPSWSSHCLPAAKVLQKAGIPMITPTGSNPEITRIGDYIFRICFTDEFQGRALARLARNDIAARTAVILVNANEAYSMTLADFFGQHFKQLGGKILWQGVYNAKAADFRDLLDQTRRQEPQVIFVPGYARDSGLIVSQARKVGIQTIFIGGDGWGGEIFDFGGEALAGCYYTTHWYPMRPNRQSRDLINSYQARFGPPSIWRTIIPLTWDAVWLLAAAAEKAGATDRAALRSALAATEKFEGASGAISFDDQGDPQDKEAFVIRLTATSREFVKIIGAERSCLRA